LIETDTDIEVAVWSTRHPQMVREALTNAGIEHAVMNPDTVAMSLSELVVVRTRDAIVVRSLVNDLLMDGDDPIQTVQADFFDWHRANDEEDWSRVEKAFAAFFSAKLSHVPNNLNSWAMIEEAEKMAVSEEGHFDIRLPYCSPEEGGFDFIFRTEGLALSGSVFPRKKKGFEVQINEGPDHGFRALIGWLRSQTPKTV